MEFNILRFRVFFGPRGPREGHRRIPLVRRNQNHKASSKSRFWEGGSWRFCCFLCVCVFLCGGGKGEVWKVYRIFCFRIARGGEIQNHPWAIFAQNPPGEPLGKKARANELHGNMKSWIFDFGKAEIGLGIAIFGISAKNDRCTETIVQIRRLAAC